MRRTPLPQLESFPPEQLALYHRNPRLGSVKDIADSLRAHGQYKPVVVNKGTHTGRPNEVLAGNHTVKAFRDLIAQDAEDPRWHLIHAYVIDVDDDEAARIVLVDNRTSELGQFDLGALTDLLSGLPDLDGTAYTDIDLDNLRAALEPPVDPYKEWEGMPHYDQEDNTPDRSITVHFRDRQNVQTFAELINIPISDKARSIYFPREERQDLTGVHYVGGDDADAE